MRKVIEIATALSFWVGPTASGLVASGLWWSSAVGQSGAFGAAMDSAFVFMLTAAKLPRCLRVSVVDSSTTEAPRHRGGEAVLRHAFLALVERASSRLLDAALLVLRRHGVAPAASGSVAPGLR